jgi:hypothetical protein
MASRGSSTSAFGFEPTGEIDEGEIVLRLDLSDADAIPRGAMDQAG